MKGLFTMKKSKEYFKLIIDVTGDEKTQMIKGDRGDIIANIEVSSIQGWSIYQGFEG